MGMKKYEVYRKHRIHGETYETLISKPLEALAAQNLALRLNLIAPYDDDGNAQHYYVTTGPYTRREGKYKATPPPEAGGLYKGGQQP